MSEFEWTPVQIAKLCSNMEDKYLMQEPTQEIARLARYVKVLALYVDALMRVSGERHAELRRVLESTQKNVNECVVLLKGDDSDEEVGRSG